MKQQQMKVSDSYPEGVFHDSILRWGEPRWRG